MKHSTLMTLLVLALAISACKKDSKTEKETPKSAEKADGEKPTEGKPAAAKEKPPVSQDTVRPPMAADLEEYTKDLEGDGPLMAKFVTSVGEINCELYEKEAPMTVANFVGLARGLKPFRNPKNGEVEKRPFYDGIIFHRVIPSFMIQTGDPLGKGVGGPGYTFADEFNDSLLHDQPGRLSMANAGPGTNGSQIFITERPTPHLDQRRAQGRGHTVFGQCKELDIIKKIANVPKAPGSSSRPAEDVVIQRLEISRGAAAPAPAGN